MVGLPFAPKCRCPNSSLLVQLRRERPQPVSSGLLGSATGAGSARGLGCGRHRTLAQPIQKQRPGTRDSRGLCRPKGARTGGLQAGYNWQISAFLLGIEGDANWLGGSASRTLIYPGPAPAAGDTRFDSANATFLATIRGREGVVFDNVLLYGTGGDAFETIKTADGFASKAALLVRPETSHRPRTRQSAQGGRPEVALRSASPATGRSRQNIFMSALAHSTGRSRAPRLVPAAWSETRPSRTNTPIKSGASA